MDNCHKFEKLDCWKNSIELTEIVYSYTDKYPKKESFALCSQTNRAVVSIAANIAEGSSRHSSKDLSHFLEISIGSAYELETLLIIALNRRYISHEEKEIASKLLSIIIKQIYGFRRKLNESK